MSIMAGVPATIHLLKYWEKGAKHLGSAKDIAGYYAAIACLDREIGRILATIDNNTIVEWAEFHRVLHCSELMNCALRWAQAVLPTTR